ncbi:biosynthetic-type acetolactate synthase large subunit [bacterium]|nr:biosynthetic-type acetolactate synthase large subunit [bacterium]MBU3955002.1 biosynthetic-type acetolactate synthase large subunit [bacterium]MBU4134141.1 biosynthetic-type acetolactate synthase large subunit [bacterium]
MKLTGAEIILKCLERECVDTIFGIPGGSVLPLFDKIYSNKKIKLFLTRHEQGAAHMADGYARASGKVGVCVATSGPGATNLVTGLATALLDSIPMVAVTGQVASHLVGNDAFQEADTTGITRPVTKQNFLVIDVKDLSKTFAQAFYLARTGRPGPVLIDVPVDIQNAVCEYEEKPNCVIRGYKPNFQGHPKQVAAALAAILASKKPLIYAGGGVISSGADKELTSFARALEIPVTLTLMGIGGFPGTDKLFIGMPGMHGTQAANFALQNSDLIFAVGARFDDRVTGKISAFAPHAKIVQIDIDPTSISKNVPAEIPVVGDCKTVLREMLAMITKIKITKKYGPWTKQVLEVSAKKPLTYKKDSVLRPQFVIEKFYEMTKGKALIATEVGQNQMWAEQFYKYDKPRQFITSGGLGTMGYGLPAAIGAKRAHPEKEVIDIAGDGSIQMNIQELATAKVYGIKVIVAILNNSCLGMVRQWQQLFYGRRYSGTLLGMPGNKAYWPDFKKVAEAYGLIGMRIEKKADVEGAIKKALSAKETVVMDFQVEKEENVSPMVPGGAPIDQILDLA